MTPVPYFKTFPVDGGHEAEVWIDVPSEPYPVSIHTTAAAQRKTTVERRAQQWIDSEDCVELLHLELYLLGAE